VVVPSLPFCLCDILTVSILVPDHFEHFAYARGHQYLNIQIFVLLSYLRVVVRKLVQEYQFGLVPWRDILRCNNNNKRYYSVIEVPTAALHWRNGGEYRAPFTLFLNDLRYYAQLNFTIEWEKSKKFKKFSQKQTFLTIRTLVNWKLPPQWARRNKNKRIRYGHMERMDEHSRMSKINNSSSHKNAKTSAQRVIKTKRERGRIWTISWMRLIWDKCRRIVGGKEEKKWRHKTLQLFSGLQNFKLKARIVWSYKIGRVLAH
jgi:hypothetical protein